MASRKSTCFQGSTAGPSLFGSPDGQMIDLFGRVRAPVSPTPWPAKDSVTPTPATSGQRHSGSSESAGPASSSESRSPVPKLSGKLCRTCGEEKPGESFRKHNKGGLRGTCENKYVRNFKPWRKMGKKAYQASRRKTHRGFSLVNDAKRRAIKKGIPFDLDWKEIQARIDAGVCEETGIPFDLGTPHAWNAPSIDQVTPGAGYTKTNIRIVLYALNTMANSWGDDVIIKVAEAIQAKRAARRKQCLDASNALSQRLGEAMKLRLSRFGSMEYEMTWKEHITPLGHAFWRHAASHRRTSDSGFTGWPSPMCPNRDNGNSDFSRQIDVITGQRVSANSPLTGWPSPRGGDDQKGQDPAQARKDRGAGGPDLPTAAFLSGWPTPDTNCDRGPDKAQGWTRPSGCNRGSTLTRTAYFAGWATPVSQPANGTPEAFLQRKRESVSRGNSMGICLTDMALQVQAWIPLSLAPGPTSESSTASMAKPGVLDVRLPAWLMGYPVEWLRCSPGWESLVLIQRLLAESSMRPDGAESAESAVSGTPLFLT